MTTKHEKEWYRKFQEGTFLIRGWQSRKKEILSSVPETKKGDFEALLDNLGEKIGKEWAKDRSVRKIDTPALQRWGDTLRKSRKKSPDKLVAEIKKLDLEVDDMLA